LVFALGLNTEGEAQCAQHRTLDFMSGGSRNKKRPRRNTGGVRPVLCVFNRPGSKPGQHREIHMSVSSHLQCTSCGGADIQRLSLVYQSGTSDIQTTTRGSSTGIGFAGGGRLGVGTAVSSHKTRGTQMTELAKRAAPPAKSMAFGWVAIGIIAAIILSALNSGFLAVLALAGCGFLAYRGFTHNANVYPGLKSAWEQSWLCHRCGDTFTP
jgi:hypothetical protein